MRRKNVRLEFRKDGLQLDTVVLLVNHLAQAADKQSAAFFLHVLVKVVQGRAGPLSVAAATLLVAARVPVAPAVEALAAAAAIVVVAAGAGAAVVAVVVSVAVAGRRGSGRLGTGLAAPAHAAGRGARLLGLAGADLERTAANRDVERFEGVVGRGLVGEVDEAVARVAAADGVDGDVNLFKVAKAALVEHLLDRAGLDRVQEVSYILEVSGEQNSVLFFSWQGSRTKVDALGGGNVLLLWLLANVFHYVCCVGIIVGCIEASRKM